MAGSRRNGKREQGAARRESHSPESDVTPRVKLMHHQGGDFGHHALVTCRTGPVCSLSGCDHDESCLGDTVMTCQ